ncbi:hypothetical protein [Stutzerimonas urumqiensis]|uniref:hypothetical protein n=1 Tax=Stutzerimonas urumqiensis TaxID=638269 RepID=UPI003BAB9ACF
MRAQSLGFESNETKVTISGADNRCAWQDGRHRNTPSAGGRPAHTHCEPTLALPATLDFKRSRPRAMRRSKPCNLPWEDPAMSKGMDSKKKVMKKPLKSAQEKRSAKRAKKAGTSASAGIHAATH